MKTFIQLFLFTLVTICSVSCSKADFSPVLTTSGKETYMDSKTLALVELFPEDKQEEVIKKRKAIFVLGEYLSLDKETRTYSLDISEKTAYSLGVETEIYKEISKDIADVNNLIRQFDSEGIKFELYDVKAKALQYKNPENHLLEAVKRPYSRKTDRIAKYTGFISTTGAHDEQSQGFQNQSGAKEILCKCRLGAIIQGFIITISDSSGPHSEAFLGSAFCERTVTLQIIASEPTGYVSVKFRTCDPNGGTCFWYAY